MFDLAFCLMSQHDLGLLAVSFAVCMASFAVSAAVWRNLRTTDRRRRNAWIACGGLVAGGGMWATHFIAMLAYRTPAPVTFDLEWTSLSLIVAILGAWSAFALAERSRAAWIVVASGILFGVTVSALHFIGMLGLETAARRVWQSGLIVAATSFCVAFGVLAMAVRSREPTIGNAIKSAALLSAAVLSLHLTAMTAVRFIPDPTMFAPREELGGADLSWMVAIIVIVMLLAVTFTTIADHQLALAEAESRAKSKFLTTMSHELRTPLTSIVAYAELIAETARDEGAAQFEQDAETIIGASKHLLFLISEILDFSRLEADMIALRRSTFALQQFVDDVEATARPLIEQGGNTFVVDLRSRAASANMDEARLRQCVLNLLSNAAKFTQNGVVELLVRTEERGGVHVLRFDVSDTGVGIQPSAMDRIFRPFAQADDSITRRFGGTGLGLAITKQLIEKMGGAITVESQPDVGSLFTIWAPTQQTGEKESASDVRRLPTQLVSGVAA